MQLNEIFSNFNLGKGFGKFGLGVLAVAITMAIKNPDAILKIIPEHWQTMTIAGALLEALDYVLVLIDKARGVRR